MQSMDYIDRWKVCRKTLSPPNHIVSYQMSAVQRSSKGIDKIMCERHSAKTSEVDLLLSNGSSLESIPEVRSWIRIHAISRSACYDIKGVY